MIDHESLLEFEQGLSDCNPKDVSITLHNLKIKIEYNLTVPCEHSEIVKSDNITEIFESYNYHQDEFTTCSKCGESISSQKSCCLEFINETKVCSGVEKSYWLSFLEDPTRTINSLPNYSQFLILQQGVPYQIRSLIWKKLFLISYNNQIPQTSLLIFNNFQHSYNSETSDQISKDLNRTFPSISFFSQCSNIKDLEIILNVYANYDVELGYCQGLLFLVGTLFYQLNDPELTFHSLITIMESEIELHDIFTQNLMSVTLNKWHEEFSSILSKVDPELYNHLSQIVDLRVFLFQWWLSFMSSHTPCFVIINRIMDFCLIQGWKIGMFKISLGLLISNKPILMSLTDEDQEVIYQHLLNESKWGSVVNDINDFFGELLFSFDSKLFYPTSNKPTKTHKRTYSSMMDKFKGLNISNYSLSAGSIFSKKDDPEVNSIYTEFTFDSESSGSDSFLKVPGSKEKVYKELLIKCLENLDESNIELRKSILSALQ